MAGTSIGQKDARRVIVNAIILIVMRVVMPSLSVILLMALPRHLGAEGLGHYSLAIGFLTLMNVISPLGLQTAITREGARHRADLGMFLENSLTLTACASAVLMAATSVGAELLGYDDATRDALNIVSLAIYPATIRALQDAAFIALERMGNMATVNFTENVIAVSGGLGVLFLGGGLKEVLLMSLLGRVAASGVGCVLLRRQGFAMGFGWNRPIIRQLMSWAPTFLLIGIFATIYWRIDIFLLSKLGTMEDVGYYGAAWRILELSMVVPQSLCLSLYPKMVGLVQSNPAALGRFGRTTLRYLLAISLPSAMCTTVLGDDILAFLFGESFRVAAPTLIVLMWTFAVYGYVRYDAYLLLSSNRQRVDLILNMVMSVVNIAANVVLIPLCGPMGSALATLISIMLYLLLQELYLAKSLPELRAKGSLAPAVLVASLAAGATALDTQQFGVFVAGGSAIAVYFVCLYLARFFSPEELAAVGLDRFSRKKKARPATESESSGSEIAPNALAQAEEAPEASLGGGA